MVRQCRYVERAEVSKRVRGCRHSHQMHRIKQPAGECWVNRGHYGEVHVALLKAARQAGAAILDQMDLNVWATLPIPQ